MCYGLEQVGLGKQAASVPVRGQLLAHLHELAAEQLAQRCAQLSHQSAARLWWRGRLPRECVSVIVHILHLPAMEVVKQI